jgi:hypothetical protein
MTIRNSDLEAWLDEALPPAEMARLEQAVRQDRKLIEELSAINARRDAGVHTLGEIWRRHRLSCPTREQLGGYLLGALDAGLEDYLRFHLDVAGCRPCLANLADLRNQESESAASAGARRRKYFESSAGYLRGRSR